MRSVFDMTGVERAAALLVALGPEIASDIIRHLDGESIDKISVEMARINRLTPEDREELIGEFMIELRRNRRGLQAGENKAREMLSEAFGSEKTDEIMDRIEAREAGRLFEFLQDIDGDVIHSFIKDEQNQTIALVMSYLPSDKSAEILKALDTDRARDVALRMARMTRIAPEALVQLSRALKKKYEHFISNNRSSDEPGGVESLVNILSHMSGDDEQKIMKSFDMAIPDVSREIRDKIFSFENVVNLTNSEVRILIDEIDDDRIIAMALKGAGDELRFKFLRNMSQNRATDVLTDMDAMGPVRLSEVEDYRKQIVTIMRDLHENGVISLRKDDDRLVE